MNEVKVGGCVKEMWKLSLRKGEELQIQELLGAEFPLILSKY